MKLPNERGIVRRRIARKTQLPRAADAQVMNCLFLQDRPRQIGTESKVEHFEASRAEWNLRSFWNSPPWVAHLSVAASVDETQVAHAANHGARSIAANFDVDNRKTVDFGPDDYRGYAGRVRKEAVNAALASALTSECRANKNRLPAAPLVMMFGQGHQFFLERLMAITSDQQASDEKMIQVLFRPWPRKDDAEGFRWDPADDQRYAFRYSTQQGRRCTNRGWR